MARKRNSKKRFMGRNKNLESQKIADRVVVYFLCTSLAKKNPANSKVSRHLRLRLRKILHGKWNRRYVFGTPANPLRPPASP